MNIFLSSAASPLFLSKQWRDLITDAVGVDLEAHAQHRVVFARASDAKTRVDDNNKKLVLNKAPAGGAPRVKTRDGGEAAPEEK